MRWLNLRFGKVEIKLFQMRHSMPLANNKHYENSSDLLFRNIRFHIVKEFILYIFFYISQKNDMNCFLIKALMHPFWGLISKEKNSYDKFIIFSILFTI